MCRYKSAYDLGLLDPLDLQLCLDTDMNQADYDGSRRTDADEHEEPSTEPTTP